MERVTSPVVLKNRKMPYIIAEIGFNHEGNMALAGKMIEKAALAGADAVKFQTYRAIDLALPSSPHFKAIKCGEMSPGQHAKLYGIAKMNGIDFLSTPYSLWAVDLLEKIGVKAYKLASMDLMNVELLRYVAKTRKPLYISTGMANLSEIVSTVEMLRRLRSGPVTVLHCLSSYPANPHDINLSFMKTIHRACRCEVGYSDHMQGTFACLVAAILGAGIIEKHFTLDTSLQGADHYHSADTAQLKKLIEDIRFALSVIGGPGNILKRADRKYVSRFRRGVYASTDIPKGAKISKKALVCCRPESYFSPSDLDKIVGRIACSNIKANASITKRCLS